MCTVGEIVNGTVATENSIEVLQIIKNRTFISFAMS